ncbi:MAG: hypothetical protein CL623_12350 [Arcobacter sp.]|nr:hypothetical protein [Arcobacter sp.]|tara:strand:+ start:23500 stop:23877 length:378 start_codon:yes stop_codon:yes gene_type:complete
MEFLTVLLIVGILSIMIVDKESQIKSLEEENQEFQEENELQKEYIQDLNESIDFQHCHINFVICYIDKIEDKNEKERFAKYLLNNEHFLEHTNGIIDFIQDEKERDLYIKKYNQIIERLECMSWK